MPGDDTTMTCATCGRSAPGDDTERLLTWVRAVENGRPAWTCDGCSRSHLRSIEAKLDSTWW